MDQDRRDAAAWAQEWRIRQKNKVILMVVGAIVVVALLAWLISFIVIKANRTTYGSAEEMRADLQGRFAVKRDYVDILIEGDDLILTYYEMSHYDREYAERYGYSEEYDDVVYEDTVTEWDYRHGVIKLSWMSDIIVDKDGNIKRDNYNIYVRTDDGPPEPLDPDTLNTDALDAETAPDMEEEELLQEREESLEATEDAAEEAGVQQLEDLDTEAA